MTPKCLKFQRDEDAGDEDNANVKHTEAADDDELDQDIESEGEDFKAGMSESYLYMRHAREKRSLALSQMVNFRLFQAERVCR